MNRSSPSVTRSRQTAAVQMKLSTPATLNIPRAVKSISPLIHISKRKKNIAYNSDDIATKINANRFPLLFCSSKSIDIKTADKIIIIDQIICCTVRFSLKNINAKI